MNINIGNEGIVDVLFLFEDDKSQDKNELVKFVKEKEIFQGKAKEVYSNIGPEEKTILLGLGKKEEVSLESLRTAFFTLATKARELKVESLNLTVPKIEDFDFADLVKAQVEGLLQSTYSFEKYLSKKKTTLTIKDVFFAIEDKDKDNFEESVREVEYLIEGIFLARDLTNEPAITMTPDKLAQSAVEELKDLGVEVKVYNKEEIEELGMTAFLAVAKGSSTEPRFITMTWKGDPSSDEKIALVGKGLTYDSGGYSLKPSNSMVTMNSDMAGSATVIGTMKALAKSKTPKNVVAIVAACENLISGKAYKPGDIITSMSGKTIEILNTDAEGRVTLADALWYAATVEKADKIIDLATLTGACIVALGDTFTGAVTNNEDFISEVLTAAETAGEPVWKLPSHNNFKEAIKGDLADLSNTGKNGAGAITAGMFLGEFVNDIPWVHLDIAGPSHLEAKRDYLPKGATGIHVKTLYNLVTNN